MHPDQRRLQLLNDLIAQTLDVITQQRTTGGFSHTPYQTTPTQQWNPPQQYQTMGYGQPQTQQFQPQMPQQFGPQTGYGQPQFHQFQPQLPQQFGPQTGYGQPQMPQQVTGQNFPQGQGGFGHSPYQQQMMDPYWQQQLFRQQQQNMPWQQQGFEQQNVPGTFQPEQRWEPRGFGHSPYQGMDPMRQQQETEWNQQRQMPHHMGRSGQTGQYSPMPQMGGMGQQGTQGFGHSSYESMDPIRRQQSFFQGPQQGQSSMNMPWDPNMMS